MNQSPLVSAIIIFLNEARFIQESIESVLAQTYDNWELLLVDDGSTDDSSAIAQRYAREHPDKVHYLQHDSHTNKGMSATRNLGIYKAKGEYLTFLDGDDVWLPHNLEAQVEILRRQPKADMVYINTHYWHNWTGNPEDAKQDYVDQVVEATRRPNTLFQPPELLTTLLKIPGTIPCVCSLMVKRDRVLAIGGFEESFRGLYEDQAFYARICLESPVFISTECGAKYRQHPDSCCSIAESTGREKEGRRIFLVWLEQYLQEKEVTDSPLLAALKEQLRFYRDRAYHPDAQTAFNAQIPLSNFLASSSMSSKRRLKQLVKRTLPTPVQHWLRATLRPSQSSVDSSPIPRVGGIDFGSFRRVTPLSREFGYDRGEPIDRYYIENFLARQARDIQGRTLEIGDATYTQRFGAEAVTQSDVLHVVEGNPEATIVGDLTHTGNIPANAFDCVVLTQTLHLLYDMKTAVTNIYQSIKPGGILLATVPGISQVVKCDWGNDWCWALTQQSAQLLFEEAFPKENIRVEIHGNVLSAMGFLQGIAAEELTTEELDYQDDEYQVLITIRAQKPGESMLV